MRRKVWVPVFVLFLFLIIYIKYGDYNRAQKRMQHFELAKCEIVQVSVDVMNGHAAQITYTVSINYTNITRTISIACDKLLNAGVMLKLYGLKMDVLYEKNDPENCELLLSKKAYGKYNLLPPRELVPVLNSINAVCGVMSNM